MPKIRKLTCHNSKIMQKRTEKRGRGGVPHAEGKAKRMRGRRGGEEGERGRKRRRGAGQGKGEGRRDEENRREKGRGGEF